MKVIRSGSCSGRGTDSVLMGLGTLAPAPHPLFKPGAGKCGAGFSRRERESVHVGLRTDPQGERGFLKPLHWMCMPGSVGQVIGD